MDFQQASNKRAFRIFTTFNITLIMLLLSSCIRETFFATPIPCGDTDRLIQAIEIANMDSDPDTIELTAGCVYELTEIYNHEGTVGSTGLPQIISDITIVGNGGAIVRSSAEGTPKFRLILVDDDGTLFLQDLTLQNGYADDPAHPRHTQRNSGGAISNDNYLTLENVTIQNNRATGGAGGIFNFGTLFMIKSSITGSYLDYQISTYSAAAFHNHWGATATIVQSTIYGNNISRYSSIPSDSIIIVNYDTATMFIENSTISENNGRAIVTNGDLDLIFSTIANNTAGIVDYGHNTPNLAVSGSLLQNTTNCMFQTTTLTVNLNNMDSDGTCGFTHTVSAADQGLLPLTHNGGATLTQALDPSSPAIDAYIGDCPVYEDQRDITRPQYGICDIGAYEYDDFIPPVGGEIIIPPTETPIVPLVDDPGVEPGGGDEDPPPPVPDRCDHFDSENTTLTMHDIPYGSTVLEMFIQYQHMLPGLEEEIPGDTRPWEYSATLGNAVADKCTYREYSGRLYCTFTLTKAHFGFAYPLDVMVNFCEIPIFSHPGVTVFEPEKPTIACSNNLNKSDCQASGGTYHDINQVCQCP